LAVVGLFALTQTSCKKLVELVSGGEAETKADSPAASAAPAPIPSAVTPANLLAPPLIPEQPLEPGRSKLPTLEEWAGVPKEVTVKGSSALSCETKMVREYLRVRCTGKNDSGGTPTGVRLVKGSAGAIATTVDGVTNLIVPFVDGTDFAAVFSWTDKSHRLVAIWPKGAPKPSVIATFEGAKSPIDAAFDQQAQKRLCECVREVTQVQNCSDALASPNVDCFKTYQKDCGKLFACSRGEPSVPPRCEVGFVNGGPGNWCHKRCGTSDPCPEGEKCQSGGGVPIPFCL
jgi:hypothetical protein